MSLDRSADVPARLRGLLVRAGWAAALVVVVGTVIAGLPAAGPAASAVVVLTVVAVAGWLASLDERLTGRALAGALLVTGLSGAALDLLRPSGPGFILAYMAMAGLGLQLHRRAAAVTGAIVLVPAATAEAVTSDHPVSAALNLTLGAALLLLASAFAAANRDARARAEELLSAQRQTRAAQERAAVLSERARLAREIHDILAHTLSGLAVHLEGARLLADRTAADPRLVDHLTAAREATRTGLVNARQAVATLRGESLPGPEDLPELVEEARLRGLVVSTHVVGMPVPLAPQTALTVYRCVQESLTNATKHAGPGATVTVTVVWAEGTVAVEVVDEAGGSPAEHLPTGGFGLGGLAERAVALGGRCEHGPTETGWRVCMTLPTTAPAQPEELVGVD